MFSPGWVAQLVGALSYTSKGCRFDSRSGHIPRLIKVFISGPGVYGGNQLMFLSHVNDSLSLPPSAHPLPLSLKSVNISLGEYLKKNNYVHSLL